MSLHFKHYIFDLDNTLYHSSSAFFNQQLEKMSSFICDLLKVTKAEADFLRDDYYRSYGTTMHGLIHNHGIQAEKFLSTIDAVPLDRLQPDEALLALLLQLKQAGKQLCVFTNGSDYHARRVMKKLQLDQIIEDVVTLESTGLIPKPDKRAYQHLLKTLNIEPTDAVFFEDSSHNLIPAKALGMQTVLVNADETAHARFIAHKEIDLLVEDIEHYFNRKYLFSRLPETMKAT